MLRSRHLLLLASVLLAFAFGFKPECSKPNLLTLRGGVSDISNAAYRRPGHTYRPQGPSPFLGDLSNEPPMSDAERVYVVQQFSQQQVRKNFLKRVYAILSAQLAVTAGLAVTIRGNRPLLLLLVKQQWVLFLVLIGSLLWLSLSRKARQEAPLNGLLLAAFTLAQASLTP